MKTLFSLFVIIISCNSSAQAPPAINIISPNAYGALESHRFYDGLNQMVIGDHPLNYLAVLPQYFGLDRPIPLMDGEGERGYILEGNLDQIYTVYRGRIFDTQFWQTSTISIRYSPIVRLSLDEDSKPAMPLNNKLGLRIDKGIWDNVSEKDNHEQLDTVKFQMEMAPNNNLQYIYLTINAAHYSNGMRSGSYINDTTVIRNDYADGNFSTNYANISFTYSSLKNNKLRSVSLGYQREFGFKGVAEYTDEQVGRYGYNRILTTAQYRFKPFALWGNRKKECMKYFYWYDYHKDTLIKIKRMAEFRLRFESECIIDNSDKLELYDRSNLYRFSGHLFAEINPWKWRTVGMFIHAFYGRDYLNIRYDDPIFAIMGGFTLDFKKFIPPFMKPKEFEYTKK